MLTKKYQCCPFLSQNVLLRKEAILRQKNKTKKTRLFSLPDQPLVSLCLEDLEIGGNWVSFLLSLGIWKGHPNLYFVKVLCLLLEYLLWINGIFELQVFHTFPGDWKSPLQLCSPWCCPWSYSKVSMLILSPSWWN